MELELTTLIYKLDGKKSLGQDGDEYKSEIMKIIKDNFMSPIYANLVAKYNWEIDSELLTSMEENNAKDLANIESKMQDAIKNAGDTEVLDAMIEKAKHFTKTGNWKDAVVAHDAVINKDKTSTGKKLDANMDKLRIALFNMDLPELKKVMAESKRLVEIGGDWDRRNRLKVYEAHYLLANKDTKKAAALLLDGVATFSSTELCSYKTFMAYTILTNVIYLDRNALRKKLVNDPHVITVIRELPHLQKLLNGIYNCDYKQFFEAIITVYDDMVLDPFLGPVATFLVRELRVLAYSQFLESYKSVQFSAMAASFNLTPELLDAELSRFIAAGRLNAKIDKVGDIIETKRPDKKNFQYQEVIKKGDVLLNSIQKLVRAIDI